MDKDKSPDGHGLPPFSSSRYSPSPSPTSGSFQLKPEASTPSSSATGSTPPSFSHDISKMSDFPPRNTGHRRAHSEILSLPDDISFDSDLGVVGCNDGPSLSDENEDDIVSLYMDVDKFSSLSPSSGGVSGPTGGNTSNNSNVSLNVSQGERVGVSELECSGPGSTSERPTRGRHQHSQSMDGTISIKTELLASGYDSSSLAEAKKAMSAAKLADLALVDPKRAKRIWANRQSAARSKERKMRYIAELERKVQTLQTEATTLSAQLTMLQRDTTGLTVENNELKLRLQTMEQQVHLQDALNDALREEVQRLKMMTGQVIQNGGQMLNYGSSSFGTNQYYSQNQNMQSLLASHQLQQLNLRSQQQLHPNQLHLQQHALPSEVKIRAPIVPPHSRRDSSSDVNGAPAKE